MKLPTPQMRDLAGRLIAWEGKAGKTTQPNRPPVFHVCERLRPHLTTLMGEMGFRAVLSRALAITGADHSWVAALQVDEDGTLSGWEAAEPQVAAQQSKESGELLVAQLLGLLTAFIGDNLTLQLVRDVWPKLPLENLKFTQGDPS